MVSQYLNVFVLVVQLFLKVPALHALAPTGSEPPFAIVQAIVLLLHVGIGFLALRRFHPRRRSARRRPERSAVDWITTGRGRCSVRP